MTTISALPFDPLIVDIADYVMDFQIQSDHAFEMSRWVLLDSMACAFEALEDPACLHLLGAYEGQPNLPLGARVPGTAYQLDPVNAAFNTGCLVRWTDFSDTWVAAQTTHPSDDVGAILAVCDYRSRILVSRGEAPLSMRVVLAAMIKAHEIQGVLGMGQSLNPYGIDHTFLVKIACAAVCTELLGGTREQVLAATSLAFFDAPLCVHRFGSNTGPRKGWAAAEAASHAVSLAFKAIKGEPGYPQVLSHPQWGFCHTRLKDQSFRLGGCLGSLVMENVLFKLLGPVVIHAQSAIECALALSGSVKDQINNVERIEIYTHHRTLETIDKSGPLRNPADRDHCLQYAMAVTLLNGALKASDYRDEAALDPRIDQLRHVMVVKEDPNYTQRYLDPALRANSNGMEIFYKNGHRSGRIEFENPVGHPSRRDEAKPILVDKLSQRLKQRYTTAKQKKILKLGLDHQQFILTPVPHWMNLLATRKPIFKAGA